MAPISTDQLDLDEVERILEAERAELRGFRRDRLDLLSEREAALALNRREAALIALRKAGGGPAFVVLERGIFYRLTALRDWLAGLERPAGSPRMMEGV